MEWLKNRSPFGPRNRDGQIVGGSLFEKKPRRA